MPKCRDSRIGPTMRAPPTLQGQYTASPVRPPIDRPICVHQVIVLFFLYRDQTFFCSQVASTSTELLLQIEIEISSSMLYYISGDPHLALTNLVTNCCSTLEHFFDGCHCCSKRQTLLRYGHNLYLYIIHDTHRIL